MPNHNRVQRPRAQIVEHPQIRGPWLAAVGAHIVIDVALLDLPTLPLHIPLTILDLTAARRDVSRPDQTKSERRQQHEPLK